MKNIQIYLSGGMQKYGSENFDESNGWRLYCQKVLQSYDSNLCVEVINPNDYFNFQDDPKQYDTQDEVMRFDLYKLRNSDLVIVNFNDVSSLGTMAEIAIAYDRNIPIIGLDKEKQNLHPWQTSMCERIFNNMNDMLDYVEDFYLR